MDIQICIQKSINQEFCSYTSSGLKINFPPSAGNTHDIPPTGGQSMKQSSPRLVDI
jgi:hypothetical protein